MVVLAASVDLDLRFVVVYRAAAAESVLLYHCYDWLVVAAEAMVDDRFVVTRCDPLEFVGNFCVRYRHLVPV